MCEIQHHLNYFLKTHWIWTIKMDFHIPFLGERSVQLPKLTPSIINFIYT